MWSQGSLLCSWGPTTGPYLEPDASSPHLPTPYPKNTNYMEQSPSWEANSHLPSQEIPLFLRVP
jgi:hypothetical protein